MRKIGSFYHDDLDWENYLRLSEFWDTYFNRDDGED